MKTRPVLGAAAAAVAGLLLISGCSAANPGTTASQQPSSTRAVAETPTASAPSTVKPGRAVPASCSALSLAPGAHLDGAALGVCVSQALSSYGSGKMAISSSSLAANGVNADGSASFTYDPEYNVSVEANSETGSIKMVYFHGTLWLDSGNGMVKGDPNSSDPQEYAAAQVAQLYRYLSDLQQTVDLVKSQPAWTVQDGTDLVPLPNGPTVEAYKIVSDGAFSWNGMPISEYILWFAPDWVPVGSQGTLEYQGTNMTSSQTYFDLGSPVTITPPS